MASLEDILPESLIPSGSKKNYKALKQTIENIEDTGKLSKRVKDAIIADMNDILDTITREKVKQNTLTKFSQMLGNIKVTKQSEIYSSSYNNSSESGGGGYGSGEDGRALTGGGRCG